MVIQWTQVHVRYSPINNKLIDNWTIAVWWSQIHYGGNATIIFRLVEFS